MKFFAVAAAVAAASATVVSAGHANSPLGQSSFKVVHGRAVQHARSSNNQVSMADGEPAYNRLDQGKPAESDGTPAGAKVMPSGDVSTGRAFSPPFYPTPQTVGTGKWAPAVAKAKKLVAQLTTEEKVTLTTGVGWTAGRCVGNIAAIPRVGFPGLCLEDSPLGVRFADLVTSYPAGITTAATFSSELTYRRGVAMGQEHRTKGVSIQLGPGMNMLRAPAAGRNWEMCGADPYLCGEAAYQTILGVQSQGVQANAKHYIGNEQEHFRETSSSNIDDRTLREFYEHPFLRAVQADVASFMCSYNQVNNSWACQNSDLLNRRLKHDMGYPGAVISDWGATHSGVSAVNAGLDMTMPGDVFCCFAGQTSSYFGANLTQAVNNGSVERTRLDDMATRILAGWYLVGQDDKSYPTPNFDAFRPQDAPTNEHVNAMRPGHAKVARDISAAGTVVLKNTKNALPLRKPKKVALIGSDAAPARRGANFFGDRGGVDGTLGIGWGSGTAEFAYLVSPYEAISQRARQDSTGIYWSFDDFDVATAQTVARDTDAALVFAQSDSGEAYITFDGNAGDRNNLTVWHEAEALVQKVASVNKNTIVVIHAPAQVDLEAFHDHPNVTAIVWAGMPGSESGSGLADVLYGDVNPSGRLPMTIAKSRDAYTADVVYETSEPNGNAQINYQEGIFVDYRDANLRKKARYAFGHGLSYTSFKYSNLKGQWTGAKNVADKVKGKGAYPAEIFKPVYKVTFDVRNSGGRDGFEVPQVYLGFPASSGEPDLVLRKFDRFKIAKGQTRNISFDFSTYDLSIWDVAEQRWRIPSGPIKVIVGASSVDIRQTITIQ